jgi:hypothetical protein
MRLLNHFIGAHEKQFRKADIQRFGGLEVPASLRRFAGVPAVGATADVA